MFSSFLLSRDISLTKTTNREILCLCAPMTEIDNKERNIYTITPGIYVRRRNNKSCRRNRGILFKIG